MKNKVRFRVMLPLVIFSLMGSLDTSIVNMAMPILSKQLGVSVTKIEWIVLIYLLVISGTLMLFGRLGDTEGKIKIFKIGMAFFTVGSLIAGINLGFYFLLFSRVIQAIGSSMTMATSYGITTENFPKCQRGRAMAALGVATSIGGITDPSLSGIILGITSWNYIFWLNVPLGLFVILFRYKFFASIDDKNAVQSRQSFDIGGMILSFITIMFLFLGITDGQIHGYTSLPTICLMALFIVCLSAFVIYERSTSSPMLDFRIFTQTDFSLGVVASTLVYIVGYTYTVIMPYYLVNARHFSMTVAGILSSTIPITIFFTGPLGGKLSDIYGGDKITLIGLGFLFAAQLLIAGFSLRTSISTFVLSSMVYGFGMGLFKSPNNATMMSAVDPNFLGIAGSVNSLSINVGTMLGAGLSTAILFSAISLKAGRRIISYPPDAGLFIIGMRVTFITSACIVLIAIGILLRRLVVESKHIK